MHRICSLSTSPRSDGKTLYQRQWPHRRHDVRRIHQERILLNHEALWLPLFEKPHLPDVAPFLPEYRRLLESYQFQEADAFWRRILKDHGWPDLIYTNPYMPGFDLLLTQEIGTAFSSYQRRLDMSTGEVATQWQAGTACYERRLFVSRADQVVVLTSPRPAPRSVHLTRRLAAHPCFEDSRKAWHYPRRYSPAELPVRYSNGADEITSGSIANSPGRGEAVMAASPGLSRKTAR